MVSSHRRAAVPVLAALAILTGGCSGSDDQSAQPVASATSAAPAPSVSSVTSVTPAASSAGSTPADGVGDCGTVQLDQGEQLDESAAACLVRAAATKEPARLIVIQSTTEGDSVTITYLADADGAVEVSTDISPEASSGADIQLQKCTGPRLRDGELGFTRCEAEDPIG